MHTTRFIGCNVCRHLPAIGITIGNTFPIANPSNEDLYLWHNRLDFEIASLPAKQATAQKVNPRDIPARRKRNNRRTGNFEKMKKNGGG
ncbi:MAG: hypothetical protein ACOC2L_03465 [Candidatus Sumerlaeota bacterium]